ncbi:hypothetical protein BGZ51_003592 [Haplosporangium sp. Z 767]|nr:hypothetical protein BGZ50_006955 [Haplosporangium sp. Z 11]KAF9184056.1 hypothetical protein BGZ51_003592 [Haplosporangium sp. Z 767]
MALFSAQWATTIVELPTLTFHNALLPLSIFSALHGIRVSMAYRQAIEQAAEQSLRDGTGVKPDRVPWGQALLSVLAMSLGGGFTTSMLLGMPPSWLGSNIVVPTYALSFFLVHYTFVYDILKNMVPPAVLDPLLIVADGSLRALSIAKLGVDGSRMRFAADSHRPGAGSLSEPWFAMLFLGMVSGCGGGMWADLLKLKTHQWTLSTPTFVHTATYDMKAALLTAFFYASSTSPQLYALLRGDDGLGDGAVKGVLMESQDAKAMTMLLLCTLLLGQRAEPLTWIQALQAKGVTSSHSSGGLKKDDDHEKHEFSKGGTSDETNTQKLRRRRFNADEPTEGEDNDNDNDDSDNDEEELEQEPVKKGPRGGGRKKAVTNKQAQSLAVSSVDVPLTRSTRLRKSARQEL